MENDIKELSGVKMHCAFEKIDGGLAVDSMDEAIATGDNRVLVPLGDVGFDGIAFGDEPFLAFGIHDDVLTITNDNTATLFIVDHGVVLGFGMDVALVATDGPFAVLGKLTATVLNTGVVSAHLDFRMEDEVLDLTNAPDQELVVGKLVGAACLAGDDSVLDTPKFGVAIPTIQVLAVEEGTESVIGSAGEQGIQASCDATQQEQ